jgi:hypothetical protein
MAEPIEIDERSRIQDRNRELARRINDELLRDPNSPYAGKWIGIANGQVVVMADTSDEVMKRLDEIESDPFRTYCMEGVGITEEEEYESLARYL